MIDDADAGQVTVTCHLSYLTSHVTCHMKSVIVTVAVTVAVAVAAAVAVAVTCHVTITTEILAARVNFLLAIIATSH